MKKADVIVAVSCAVKDHIAERFPKIAKKFKVVYNGNPVAIENLPAPVSQEPFLLSASKFVAYANQLNLVKGYDLLNKRKPDIPPLWLAGGIHDHAYFEKVQDYVKENQLENKIKFLGLVPHEKLIELYRNTAVFLFPSTLESCPHTLIEAMACGAPVISSASPPMSEIGKQGAIYFDPFDTDDIADKIEKVLVDECLRDKLAHEGTKRAQDFTWEKTARGLIKVFESV